MRKPYVKPLLELERYELSANIASNCAVVVHMGDYGGGVGEPACDDYLELTGQKEKAAGYAYNVNFWESTCDCYTTAGGKGFFTS